MTTLIIAGQPAPGHVVEVVLGVDTHKDVHVAAVTSPLGELLATCSFPATADGYHQPLTWARAAGVVRRAGVEGTGSYGAGLNRFLHGAQIDVTEVNRPDRVKRRYRGKATPLTPRPQPRP